MEEELLHTGEEAGECPNVLEFLGAHLRLDLRVRIFLLWGGIEPKALGAFPFELELQSPYILLGIERVTTASSEQLSIRLVAFSLVSSVLL